MPETSFAVIRRIKSITRATHKENRRIILNIFFISFHFFGGQSRGKLAADHFNL